MNITLAASGPGVELRLRPQPRPVTLGDLPPGSQPNAAPPQLDSGERRTSAPERATVSVPARPRPTSLIFDWGGVLMRTEDDSGRRRWEDQLGLPAGDVDRAIFDSSHWREAQLGNLDPDDCWKAIGRSLGLTPPALAEFRRDFWAGDRLNQTLIERIREWKAAGRQVALLSNYTAELESLLEKHQLHQLFEPIIISARVGVLKPAAALFQQTLERMRISPAEAILVDDFAENVTGARSVGLHAVLFRDTRQAVAEIEELLQ